MVQVQIRVCDVCESPTRVTRAYHLAQGAREAKLDLCDEDAAPIEALLPKRAGRKPRGTAPTGHFKLGVTSMEEIEASKSPPPPVNDKDAPPSRTRQKDGA